jgi:uncharacterized protein (DUF4415 family)
MPAKKTEAAFHQLAQVMRDLEADLGLRLQDSPRIPAAWHDIAQARMQPLKRKLTLRVDDDVQKFFRATGQGHLTRMNDVLRAFMLARLAEVVKGEMEYKITPEAKENQQRLDLMARYLAAKERGEG